MCECDTKFIVCGSLTVPRKLITDIRHHPKEKITVQYQTPDGQHRKVDLMSTDEEVLAMIYESLLEQLFESSKFSPAIKLLLDL